MTHQTDLYAVSPLTLRIMVVDDQRSTYRACNEEKNSSQGYNRPYQPQSPWEVSSKKHAHHDQQRNYK